MAGREIVKNIKPVFCRFDMDNEQERRAWQIIQKLSKGEGKKQKYNDIIAKAVVEYYDRAEQLPMKNEELLEKIEEIIDRKMDNPQKETLQMSYPFPYPYSYPAVMNTQPPVPVQQQQREVQPKTEELNETALSFMDGLMGI
ncbi:hypothetical protein IMSAGC005_00888 [Lachnospiraceae bacterium]|nr:hypothetical protein IMSAGC005_00888 [Lachnospiraceae bacterium]